MGWSVAVTAHTGVAVAGRGRTLYSQLGLKRDHQGNFPLDVQLRKLLADKRRMKQLAKIDVCRFRVSLVSSSLSGDFLSRFRVLCIRERRPQQRS